MGMEAGTMKWNADDSRLASDQTGNSSLQPLARSLFNASNIVEDLVEQTVHREDWEKDTLILDGLDGVDSPLEDREFDPFSVSRAVKDLLKQRALSGESASSVGPRPPVSDDPSLSTQIQRLIGNPGRPLP